MHQSWSNIYSSTMFIYAVVNKKSRLLLFKCPSSCCSCLNIPPENSILFCATVSLTSTFLMAMPTWFSCLDAQQLTYWILPICYFENTSRSYDIYQANGICFLVAPVAILTLSHFSCSVVHKLKVNNTETCLSLSGGFPPTRSFQNASGQFCWFV